MEKYKYISQTIKKAGKAINHYNMINENDNILVALSGGKDSIALLDILHQRLNFLPITYNIICCHVHVNNFNENPDFSLIEDLCNHYKCKLIIKSIDLNLKDKKASPCFVCSWQRRKTLFQTANEYGCNKVALGHNMDDIIATFFMNMFYSGRLSTMPPKLKMFNGKIFLIRPLAFLSESEIKGYIKNAGLVPFKNPCSFKDNTKRKEINEFLKSIYSNIKDSKSSIFTALSNVDNEYLL